MYFQNGFNEVCKSGNTMVDCFDKHNIEEFKECPECGEELEIIENMDCEGLICPECQDKLYDQDGDVICDLT